ARCTPLNASIYLPAALPIYLADGELGGGGRGQQVAILRGLAGDARHLGVGAVGGVGLGGALGVALQGRDAGRHGRHHLVEGGALDRKSTRLNSSHVKNSYAV